FLFLTLLRPPTSTLFPYTTLFRSATERRIEHGQRNAGDHQCGRQQEYRGEDCAEVSRAPHALFHPLHLLLARLEAERLHRLALRSEEHTSELQSRGHLVCRLLLEK